MRVSDAAELLETADSLCRRRGVRLTAQRRRVLEILYRLNRPVGAYELLDHLKRRVPGAVPPTVYRALDFLQTQGLAHKLESLHAYVGCRHPGDAHPGQFLICTDCGRVREVADGGVEHSVGALLDAEGFRPQRRVIEVTGTCARCRHGGGP